MLHDVLSVLDSSIVYEDHDLVVLSKPPGRVVNDAATVQVATVQSWWRDRLDHQHIDRLVPTSEWTKQVPADFDNQYGTPEAIFKQRSGLVHRLDKDTSGALLLAKHPGSLVNLLAQFRLRQVSKTYLALAHGRLDLQSGVLNFPIARNQRNRQKMGVHPIGRAAITKYQLVAEYQIPDELLGSSSESVCSLVHCWPQTGRMHQIRVHCAHINRPLVSDSLYLGRKRLKADLAWCPRHFLHAGRIEFTHPRTEQRQTVDVPLPSDLQMALQQLRPLSAT